MMRPDIISLREFYGTKLGRFVRGHCAHLVRTRWVDSRDDVMLGIGYATPILRFFIRHPELKRNVIAAMPRAQGGMVWPVRGDARAMIAAPDELPLANNVVHRAIMLHALEFCEDANATLREIWRVMTPGGRLLICVPNRRSIWSGAQGTPFGYGTPYSIAQLKPLVAAAGFTVMRVETIIFTPPTQSPLLLKLAPWLERIGAVVLPRAGGIVVMEVEKQLYAGVRETHKKVGAKMQWLPVGQGAQSTRDIGKK